MAHRIVRIKQQKHKHKIIKHKYCDLPSCIVCRQTSEPILCHELVSDEGDRIVTTQRERHLAEIFKFFYRKARDQILDKEELFELDFRTSPWFLADVLYQYYTNNTPGWSYQVHNFSRTYAGEEVVVTLNQLALYYKIKDDYIQFLKDNKMDFFIPIDPESVD